LYHLPLKSLRIWRRKHAFNFASIAEPQNYNEVLLRLLQSPNIASKEWVYSQYDHSVQINTVVRPGHGDAAVLRIRESKSNKGIAVKADCNSRYCYLDPLWAHRSRLPNARATWFASVPKPGGVTDCLCFGNPEKPDRFWQFKRSIEGIVEACTSSVCRSCRATCRCITRHRNR
jgi:phosphoribosylformylglycinamidine synthase